MLRALSVMILVVGLSMVFMSESVAEVESMELRVDGLSCPFCSLGLEKKLKRVEGVEGVQVHMKRGITELRSMPGEAPALAAIRKAVKEAGFTLRDIRLTVKGVVAYQGDAWVLEELRGDGTQFLLFDAKHAEEEGSQGTAPVALGDEYVQKLNEATKTGAQVVVEGRVHQHAGMPSGLLVERLELQGP